MNIHRHARDQHQHTHLYSKRGRESEVLSVIIISAVGCIFMTVHVKAASSPSSQRRRRLMPSHIHTYV